jgi:hypothetical protein
LFFITTKIQILDKYIANWKSKIGILGAFDGEGNFTITCSYLNSTIYWKFKTCSKVTGFDPLRNVIILINDSLMPHIDTGISWAHNIIDWCINDLEQVCVVTGLKFIWLRLNDIIIRKTLIANFANNRVLL